MIPQATSQLAGGQGLYHLFARLAAGQCYVNTDMRACVRFLGYPASLIRQNGLHDIYIFYLWWVWLCCVWVVGMSLMLAWNAPKCTS